MKTIAVLQHTDAEYLGFIEDHLEGRNIGFRYIRPAHDPHWIKKTDLPKAGLIVLGCAPYGTVSAPRLPLLQQRIDVVKSCLDQEIPVVAFGSGAQILSLATGARVEKFPLRLTIEMAHRQRHDALNAYLPETYPVVTYMSDRAELPKDARILAETETGATALFQLGDHCFGFLGHPGIKRAMIEDSFVQMPAYALDDPQALVQVSKCQPAIQESLIPIMTGLIQSTAWMRS